MRFREPMPLFEAYSAAWSYRAALGSDAIDILYIEMHQADLDAFLAVNNPILDFVVENWEAGTRLTSLSETSRGVGGCWSEAH